MITVAVGFILAGWLVATSGELIRRGETWLIAGYNPAHVSDEPGLASFCGTGFLLMGAVAAFAGGLAATLPENLGVMAVLLFAANTIGGTLLLFVGSRRFVKRASERESDSSRS